MPARTNSPFYLDSLKTALPKIFDQAQSTVANHQKNFVALYKLQSEAATRTEPIKNGNSVKLIGERAFEDMLLDMLSRVLPLKKGTTVADRIIKFLGGYTKFINEKAIAERQDQEEDEDEDTTASRFITRVIKFLLEGCVAKDKIVRYRVLQIIAETVAHLGEIDEGLYTTLRSALMDRIRDKESIIRVQAVIALSKLAGAEDVSELQEGEQSIMDVLLCTMAYDTSPEVRRAALINIPLGPNTLPAVLARTRDVDPIVRKLVYAAVLEPHCIMDSGDGIGFTHPRALSIAQREMIVQNGLGDREESVKATATKLMSTWVDVVRGKGAKEEGENEGVLGDIVAFLKLFDLTEGKIPEDALLSVFGTRVDIFDNVEFSDEFWTSLSPERAFLARVFVDHCIATKDNVRLESALPVVTALAFRIQAAYNDLLQQVQEAEEDELLRSGMEDEAEEEERRARKEEQRMDKEFVIGEMLKLAANLDYADEIGRRKMFQLVRAMISHDALPESLVERCLDVLRILSPNERDLIMLVVEVIHELRDPNEPEDELRDANDGESEFGRTPATVRTMRMPAKPPSEMTPEEQARADAIELRCLILCIGMLERINGTFEENSTLEGILGELIIPAVKRKELVLRQKGLISLGLCCLIARRMALNSFQLFLGQVQSAPEVLKISVLHIVFDILMVHEGDFLGPDSPNGDRIVEFLLHLLENAESEKVQALLCVGMSKLTLAGMITDDRVLRGLVLMYLSPDTASNQDLRQCLSYFFPVYCYSSVVNQQRIQKIFIPIYEQFIASFQEWEDDQPPLTPAQIGLMFVDWTDPQKAVAVTRGVPGLPRDESVHIDLATDIVKTLLGKDMEKDAKKSLYQLLGKLHIPNEVDDDKIRTLKVLMQTLRSRRAFPDTAAQNALTKFDDAISKKFAKQLENVSEEEFRQLETMKSLFEFLDNLSEESEEEVKPTKKAGRKRKSETASETSGQASDRSSEPPTPRPKAKSRAGAKRRRVSKSDDDDDSDTTQMASTVPKRVMPKRAATTRPRSVPQPPPTEDNEDEDDEGDDDNDDDDEEDEDAALEPPSRASKKKSGTSVRPKPVSSRRLQRSPSVVSSAPADVQSAPEDNEEEEEVDDLLG